MQTAFSNTNSNGNFVDPASATPVLDVQNIANLSVTELAPEATSENIYIPASQFYGLGPSSTNRLSGSFACVLSKPGKIGIYVDGNLQREYSKEAGYNIIDFSDPLLLVNIGFNTVVTVKLTRVTLDNTLSSGKLRIYQVK